jgi:hypothetical protein
LSLAQSLYTRSLLLCRRVVHPAVADAVGDKAIILGHGLCNRLDSLDEGHRAASASDATWSAQLPARRRDLIDALAETVLDRVLSPLEYTAIDLALAEAVRSAEVRILPMVVDRILSPNPEDEGRLAEDESQRLERVCARQRA